MAAHHLHQPNLATTTTTTITTIAQLPEPVLANVLHHVSQRDRLSCCALVSRAWAVAAAAATTAVDVAALTADRVSCFNDWLQQHAQQLISINLRYHGTELRPLILPIAGLSQLCSMTIRDASIVMSRRTQGSSQLQELTLDDCQVSASDIAALMVPHLTKLSISMVYGSCGAQPLGAVVGLLQRLPQLSSLSLNLDAVDMGDLTPLSTLQHLQSCSMSGAGLQVWVSMLRAPSLEDLTLCGSWGPDSISNLPVGGWPSLRRLRVLMVNLHPALLAHLPQLECLEVAWLRLLPAGDMAIVGDDDDEHEEASTVAGSADFMEALAHLTKLTRLQLDNVALPALDQQHLQQFSALTASSRLRELCISFDDLQPLPKHAAQYMFTVPCASLTRLDMCVSGAGSFLVWLNRGTPQQNMCIPCLDAAEINCIAACCPGLKSLAVQGALQCSPEAVQSLLRLHQEVGLLELSVGGPDLTDESGAVLAQTGLQKLAILYSNKFSAAARQRLTALGLCKVV